MNREDIQIISRHSNWSEDGVEQALKEQVYNDAAAWRKFLQLLFITLGVGFTTAGIIFFFAYNWADLHKFIKIGLVEGLLIATTLVVLFSKISLPIKNVILTGASVLVGILFAVFGQVYQTGANAYDFFLGWTIFIALWVIVSNFAPLWLLFLILLNTTLVLYSEQVARGWSEMFVLNLLFLLNAAFLIVPILLSTFRTAIKVPAWFSNVVALAVVSLATIGITIGIFDDRKTAFWVLVFSTLVLYIAGVLYGLKARIGFYLAVIGFSLIFIISALLIKISDDEAMFLLVTLFIVASVTLVIMSLIALQKKWSHE